MGLNSTATPFIQNQVPNLVTENTHFYSCQIASTNSVKQHKLRKRIAYLAERANTTKTLISLYIPPKTPIDQIIATLKKELECTVTEPEQEKQQLQSTLKRVIQQLRQHKDIPENGSTLFAGTAVDKPGNEALSVEELIPPEPIAAYRYFADTQFRLEPLREMLRDPKIVGILALDAKQASFGLLKGEQVELIESISSGVPGKTGKGGQSQRRYERERDMELAHFYRRIAEHAAKAFTENHVNVLLAGGPGQTKNGFLKASYLHYELGNMLLNIVDTQSSGIEGLREIYAKSCELLSGMCGPEEKRWVERLSVELAKEGGLAVYGLDPVLDALSRGGVQVVLVTDNTGVVEVTAVCRNCGYPKKAVTSNKAQTVQGMLTAPCEKCGSISYEVQEKDIVDVLEDIASGVDSAVEVISTASKEKDQLTALGGFAALLRYKTG